MFETIPVDTKGVYVIDRSTVLLKAYQLLCIFFANREIARRTSPGDVEASLRCLEAKFFEGEASRLLIEIAVAVRLVDDQARRQSPENPLRVLHEQRMSSVKSYDFALFDDLNLDLRKTCNKIIHSEVMEPHTTEGWEPHEFDVGHVHFDEPRSIEWRHLDGRIRFCGHQSGRAWYVLLNLEVFISAVFEVLKEKD